MESSKQYGRSKWSLLRAWVVPLVVVAAFLGALNILAYFKPWIVAEYGLAAYIKYGSFVVPFAFLCTALTELYLRAVRQQAHLDWLTEVAHLSHEVLTQMHRKDVTSPASVVEPSPARWPWGEHHTELLGHLDSAARRWWTLYEPAHPDTAPTNEMVSNWLYTERGVSKDKAKAIASILRADGLRTGPRH